MDRPTCKTCSYWEGEVNYGECHKGPPPWRGVRDVDWCGKHPDFPGYLSKSGRGIDGCPKVLQIIPAQDWWARYQEEGDASEIRYPVVCWAIVEFGFSNIPARRHRDVVGMISIDEEGHLDFCGDHAVETSDSDFLGYEFEDPSP